MRLALAAVAVAVVLGLLAVHVRSGQANPSIVRIFAVRAGIHHLDLGKPGRTAGDEWIYGMHLRDRHGGRIGYGVMICTVLGHTIPGVASFCQGTYILPLGKLVVAGTRHRRDYYVIPIVGGSGVYSDVQGVLIGTTIAVRPRRESLFFSLSP